MTRPGSRLSALFIAQLTLVGCASGLVPDDEPAPAEAATAEAALAGSTGVAELAAAKRATGLAPLTGATRPGAIKGRYLVMLEDGAAASSVDRVASRVARPELRVTARWRSVKGFAAELDDAEVAALRADPDVAYIEADAVMTASVARGLDRIDQRALPLNNVYDRAFIRETGAGVNVYVIDSGIDSGSVQLSPRVTLAFTAINDGHGAADCKGHGTEVSSIIGGTTLGVAPGVNLFSARALDCNGSGTTSGVVSAVDFVTDNHVSPAVANMSLGGSKSAALNDAVAAMINAGVITTIAAGNDGGDACNGSPASEPSNLGIVVGASNPGNDQVSAFSDIGACVDLFAPGEGIDVMAPGNVFTTNSGTSFSSPHVAGVAALYLQTEPAASPLTVLRHIITGSTKGALHGVPPGTPNRLLYVYSAANDGTDGWYVGDFNGDGKADLMRRIAGYEGADVFLSDGSELVRDGNWTPMNSGRWLVGDFNGDGKDDLLNSFQLLSFQRITVLLSDGSRFVNDGLWLDQPVTGQLFVGDFNGDGKADLMRHVDSGNGTSTTQVFLSDGTRFVSAGNWLTMDDGDDGFTVGKFNSGDARSDLFRRTAASGGSVLRSSGVSFVADGTNWTNADGGTDGFFVGDFNGDGIDDMARKLSTGELQLLRSSGFSFVLVHNFGSDIFSGDVWHTGDFNGDGKADMVRTRDGFAGAEMFRSTGSAVVEDVAGGDWTLPER